MRYIDKFQDPAWDGDVVCPNCGENPCVCKKGDAGGDGHKPSPKCGKWPCECPCPKCGQFPCTCPPEHQGEVEIKLSPTRTIKAEWEEYVYFDGEQIKTQDFILRLVEAVKASKADAKGLRDVWSNPETRTEFLATMSNAGFDEEHLKMVKKMLNLGNYDLYADMSTLLVGKVINRKFAATNWRGVSDTPRQFERMEPHIRTDIADELKFRNWLPVYSLRASSAGDTPPAIHYEISLRALDWIVGV